ncbi:uncharacterized protein LOC135370511 isoform X2 [Ornithodoros turicata]|uniref:uncharacterized protein LOC135370511 isoform X2 n=1 Tax=Ornithodoros turicata TaxID=34597 RepID=UPI003138AFB5
MKSDISSEGLSSISCRLVVGYVAPFLLVPVLLLGKAEHAARSCVYCIVVMNIYWASHIVPCQAVPLLPLVLLAVLGVMSVDDMASSYLSAERLKRRSRAFSASTHTQEGNRKDPTRSRTASELGLASPTSSPTVRSDVSFSEDTSSSVLHGKAPPKENYLRCDSPVRTSERVPFISEPKAGPVFPSAAKVSKRSNAKGKDDRNWLLTMRQDVTAVRKDDPRNAKGTGKEINGVSVPEDVEDLTSTIGVMKARRKTNGTSATTAPVDAVVKVSGKPRHVEEPTGLAPEHLWNQVGNMSSTTSVPDSAFSDPRSGTTFQDKGEANPRLSFRKATTVDEYPSEDTGATPKPVSARLLWRTSVVISSIRNFLMRRLSTASLIDSAALEERIDWEKGRYSRLQKDVMLGVALTASVGSVTNLRGNQCSLFLDRYIEARYEHKALSAIKWFFLTAPIALLGLSFGWAVLMTGYLRRYDVDEDEDTRYAIIQVLKNRRKSMGVFKTRECATMAIPTLWLIYRTVYGLRHVTSQNIMFSPADTIVGNTLCILLFVLPAHPWNFTSERLANWNSIVGNIPWGVLLVYGSTTCMARAFEVSGLSADLSRLTLDMVGISPAINQVVLILVASVLAELISSSATASILIPMSVDLAERSNVHPLYFAVPVTVASSISLMMPASNLAITVAASYADIRTEDLFFAGLSIKCFTLLALLLTINAFGNYIMNFSDIPEEFARPSRASAGVSD